MAHYGAKSASIPGAAAAKTAGQPVFVFGSNLAGRHGKGAALWARQHRGAIYGQGSGIQGTSYAIPTKGWKLESLPLEMIRGFVGEFLMYAEKYWMKQYQVTPIGCGLAGFTPEQIAPFFRGAPDNVILPDEFKAVLSRVAAQSAPAQPGTARSDVNQNPAPKTEGGQP